MGIGCSRFGLELGRDPRRQLFRVAAFRVDPRHARPRRPAHDLLELGFREAEIDEDSHVSADLRAATVAAEEAPADINGEWTDVVAPAPGAPVIGVGETGVVSPGDL